MTEKNYIFKKIPYYASPSDTHCAQATIRMGLEYFEPERKWTWEELDKLTGHREAYLTWNMRLYLSMIDLGYNVIVYDPIDYQKIYEDFEGYVNEKFSPDYAKEAFEKSDVPQVLRDAKLLIENKSKIDLRQKSYSIEEFKKLMDEGYLKLLGLIWRSILLNARNFRHTLFWFMITMTRASSRMTQPGKASQKHRSKTF